MHLAAVFALSAFPALMIAAALSDLATMTIPNRISIALVVAFVPAALLSGAPAATLGLCLGVGLAGLVIGAVMFALGWIGGGDAKVMAAAGLWLGLSGAPSFLMWTTVAGGLFGLSVLLARSWAQPWAGAGPAWLGRLLEPRGDIPYGVAIAVGALAAFPQSALVHGYSRFF
jgi:prepilin peptidase CpaA